MATILLIFIYISFISLGLPDSMLGAAWPVMRSDLHIPISIAGLLSIFIVGSTIVSSLASPFILNRLGTGKVVLFSTLLTAIALFCFSIAPSFLFLCIFAIMLGFGGGSIDTALNNYVALHYKAKHMSWLHSLWGVGCTLGPYIMSFFIIYQEGWRRGYLVVSILQFCLAVMLFFSLPLWKIFGDERFEGSKKENTKINFLHIPKALFSLLSFFSYCAVESTTGLWGSSFLVNIKGLSPAVAAKWVSLYFLGITVGRILSGFATMKFGNKAIIRFSLAILLIGILLLFVPMYKDFYVVSFVLIGLGCAPIFPCMIHDTPKKFGSYMSQTMIGFQMASGYLGSATIPPLFGALASVLNLSIFPAYLLVFLVILIFFVEIQNKQIHAVKN
ncbi:sugar MFS transporter [Caldicellulosiruptoraceae bacterium PP1]